MDVLFPVVESCSWLLKLVCYMLCTHDKYFFSLHHKLFSFSVVGLNSCFKTPVLMNDFDWPGVFSLFIIKLTN